MTLVTKKCSLWPYLALTCSFHNALCFWRPHPPTIGFTLTSDCFINKREILKTCLTNHKGSISHHIMPLVINSLRGGHTHTHTHIARTKAISRNQSHAGLWPAHAWSNKKKVKKRFCVNLLCISTCYLVALTINLHPITLYCLDAV